MIRLGVDFDNTIVRYDGAFHRLAREKNLIPPEVGDSKAAVRDYLRSVGREDDWTELQGYVYGEGMRAAEPFPGALEFLTRGLKAGLDIKIISHRTRQPYRGPAHDLHGAARRWLDSQGLFDPARVGLAEDRVIFEITKETKMARIAAEGCAVFVDDLPELLGDPAFPRDVRRILFDPSGRLPEMAGIERVTSWAEIDRLLLDASATAK